MAQKARTRVKREHGNKASPQMLYLAGFVMLFTTASRGRLDSVAIVELYRLRWQIELQFKRYKSIGDLDLLPNRSEKNH